MCAVFFYRHDMGPAPPFSTAVNSGSGRDGLRPGLDHDRPLPEPLPVDQIPSHESGGQTPHALGSPRQHSLFCAVSPGKMHDVNVLDRLLIEPAAFYVMDRAYIDYHRLRRFTTANAFFVTRTKSNLRCAVREKRLVHRTTGLRSDHTVVLNGIKTSALNPEPLR